MLFMTQEKWLQLFRHGVDGGSHTGHSGYLTAVTSEVATHEVIGSKHAIESAFGCEVRHFCYTYGRFALFHQALVGAAGCHTATTICGVQVHSGHGPFALNRTMLAPIGYALQCAAKLLSRYEGHRG